MVVILLLTPYTTNGCDGGTCENSGTSSTTSTGSTTISTEAYNESQRKHQLQQKYPTDSSQSNITSHAILSHHGTGVHCYADNSYLQNKKIDSNAISHNKFNQPKNSQSTLDQRYIIISSSSPSPPPPPLPKSKPPYELLYPISRQTESIYRVNAVPKPPRGKPPTTNQRIRIYPKDHSTSTAVIYDPVLPYQALQPSNVRHNENKENICNSYGGSQEQGTTKRPPNKITNIADIVRHVTRVNFYDIDTLQVEFEPKDEKNCDTEAITKEEEWITKKKTELTTTRQIETRVKRQVTLADGKVVEDSGPIISTNTTEDTDKQETETTEKRDLGIPTDNQQSVSIKPQESGGVEIDSLRQLQPVNANAIVKLIPRPEDGLVRETADKRVISHEVVNDYLETEDVRHLGDFSDETYINAIHNKSENLEEALLLATQQKDLIVALPKVIATTNKSRKTIDTEDSVKRCFAQSDGTIVTESKKTTEHEVIVDKDLADEDDALADNHETTTTHEARQRFLKQRDEQHVDLVADGKVISTEMRYAAETMQLEKDGSLERPGDWDSLSDRMRKLRKPQKSLLQQQKEAALLLDRKDALTKRPLDFDREEETRKGETMKWLESHFGSESTASNDSRDDAEIEPTKRTFFNVTIKSNHAINEASPAGTKLVHDKEKRTNEGQVQIGGMGKSRYYQGISNWAERKNLSTHFATKAFQDDLRETVERNRLKNGVLRSSGDKLYNGHQNVPSDYKDNYVSREDILQQKRQSISSQFLARSKRGSADLTGLKDTPDYAIDTHNETNFAVNAEHAKLHIKHDSDFRDMKKDFGIHKGRNIEYDMGRVRNSKSIDNLDNMPAPGYSFDIHKYQRDSKISSTDLLDMQSKTLDRPKVPQRKRAVERRLRQQISAPSESILVFEHHAEQVEPPPDYSPPPRSRSASPQIDYIQDLESKDVHFHATDPTMYAGNVISPRKLNQRTRFAPSSLTPQSNNPRPKMATQTTQTTPSTISSSTPTSHKSNKVGQAIGNSIRKLVSKIRSASAERKFRMKSKSKSREQSPSLQETDKGLNNPHSTTYQQYNVIDSHIGGGGQSTGYESGQDCIKDQIDSSTAHNLSHIETSGGLPKSDAMKILRRSEASDLYVSQRDIDAMANPRQRYYLGEDPYSSTLCGKENVHNPSSVIKQQQHHDLDVNYLQRKNRENDEKYVEQPKNLNRYMSTNTLGRYQKSSQRLAGSTPNLTSNNRIAAKTLPRKLVEHSKAPQDQYQASKPNGRAKQQVIIPINTGPTKPARTYSNTLSRSKSFNLHGLNGTAEQSPIYIEKLSGKQKNYQNSQLSYGYKRDPNPKDNSMLQSGLKSPSIVNLISRSQKDLTKIESLEEEMEFNKYNDRGKSKTLQREPNEKKIIFLRGSHQQAPDLLYKTHHADDELKQDKIHKYPLKTVHSLDTRSPIHINKDTASIVRGDSYGPEHHATMARREKYNLYMDDKRRGSGSTIIAVNRK